MIISSHLTSILQQIGRFPIVILVAPTGSGKSLALPAGLGKLDVKTFVSVPTRAAAISLANTQEHILGQKDVGYAAEGEVKYNSHSKVVYVTSGHLRRKMLSIFSGTDTGKGDGKGKGAGPITFCTVLILDEIHSGSIDDAINIALWTKAAKKGLQVPRLVLTTATMQEKYKTMFSQAVIQEITGKTYPVSVRYHNQDFNPGDVELYNQTMQVILSLLDEANNILVFLPGSSEIEKMKDSLSGQMGSPVTPGPGAKNIGFEILTAYGSMKPEDLQKIYAPGKNKIILATNIAETSLTIENVNVVVDTLIEKRAETSPSGGMRLTLRNIARDSAIQRCGRTGRTGPGICYRMCTEPFFAKLEEHRPDEVDRLPLHNTLLELYVVHLDPYEIFPNVDRNKIKTTLEDLKRLGALDGTGADPLLGGPVVTELGKFVSDIPMSVRNATVLFHWIESKLPLFPGIVTMSLIDSYGPSYFWTPKRNPGEKIPEFNARLSEYRKRHFDGYRGKSDVHTFINVWSDLMNYAQGYPVEPNKLKEWSVMNSINHKKFKEVISTVKRTIAAVQRMKYNVEVGPFTADGVLKHLVPLVEKVYSDKKLCISGTGDVYSDSRGMKYKLDTLNSINKLDPRVDTCIIALISLELSVGGRTGMNLVSVSIPTAGPSKKTAVNLQELQDLL